jgi:methionyl-tRNA formyltransferase
LGHSKIEKREPVVKVLFFGTPALTLPFLDWLYQNTQLVGVVCRPDEPAGRGYAITAPPSKIFAEEKNIPVFQPHGAWTADISEGFKKLEADIGIAVAYGRILPKDIFNAPKMGTINIHFSLLPKYRGAAPMQWALIKGETNTGVSSFWLEEGLDTGPLFHQNQILISSQDDIFSLREKLVSLGVKNMEAVIRDVEKNNLIRKPQTGESTLAPLLKKEMGPVVWKNSAENIVNLVRGICEWPGASTRYPSPDGTQKKIKIMKAQYNSGGPGKNPGVILSASGDGIVVQAGSDEVIVQDVQPEGKKKMKAWDFWQGARLKVGDKFE